MAVYLLHFRQAYPAGRRPQHYIGWARDVAARTAHHADGTSGATLPTVMHAAGIPFTVARVWPDGDKRTERRLKGWKKGAALCPLCRARQPFLLPLPSKQRAA